MTIVESARAAAGALAASDADSARLGYLSDAAWASLRQIGILRAFQPKRWGGGEETIADFADTVVEIGRASASAGWVASVVGVHPWQVALFPEETQEELWGTTPERALSSSYTPTGKVEKTDGGFRVSGRWSFSSGVDRCDGVILGGIVGEFELNGTAYPDFTSVILDRDQFTIKDTWNVAGLRGTGSKDVVVDDVFVPARRGQSHVLYTHGYGTTLPGQELNTAALYRVPWAVLFGLIISAGAVGAAQGFLDAWTEETRGRRSNYGGMLRDEASVQNHLAEAAWSVDAARVKLRRTATEVLAAAAAGPLLTQEERAFYRWDLARSAQVAVDATARLMRVASGRTAYTDHPLHGKFQDVMTAAGHAFLFPDPLSLAWAGRRLGAARVPEVHL